MAATAVARWAPTLWLTLACVTGVTITAPGLTGMVVSAAALVLSILLAARVARLVAARPVRHARPAQWERRIGVLRQRDPDAAGRSRPRAPSLVTLAV